MAPLTIAIAGFTGKMARLITNSLLKKHPDIKINGIARSPDKVSAALREKSNISIFSAASDDSAAIRKALKGANITICCYLGNSDLMIDGQKTLIDASIAEGVPRYLASDWSFDFRGLKLGDHPGKDWMLKYNEYLAEKEAQGSIKGVHVLNGAFTEVVWSPMLGWVDTQKNQFKYFGSGDEVLEMTTMEDAAEYTAEIAANPEATGWFKVLGDRVSVKDMAKLYQSVYKVEPTLQQAGSLDDLHKIMKEAFKKDPQNVYSWLGMHYQYYMSNGSTSLGEIHNDKFPNIKPTSVKEFLEKHTRESVAKSYLSH